jgi:nucleoside-diphosphate-sugar epimerase
MAVGDPGLAVGAVAVGIALRAVEVDPVGQCARYGDAVLDIATVIGRRLGLPVGAVPQEDFGPFGPIFAMDQPASGARTRGVLGWRPKHPGLLVDLENLRP